jgi:LysM repeat protein
MSVTIKEDLLPVGTNRPGTRFNPIGLTVHETASPGDSDEGEDHFFHGGNRNASAHYFVDTDSAIREIPENEEAWHAGPTANARYLSMELCHATNASDFQKIWDNGVWLAADMFKRHGWAITPTTLVSHDWTSRTFHETDHTDPIGYFKTFNKTWDDFYNAVVREHAAMSGSSTSAPAPAANGATHTVVSGETLWGIATKYKITVAELKSANGLASDTIAVGQVLKIPAPTQSAPAAPVAPAKPVTPAPAPKATTYTVQHGDTLWHISQTEGVSVDDLKKFNNLSDNVISVGQVLRLTSDAVVPAKPVVAPAPAPTAPVVAPPVAPVTPAKPVETTPAPAVTTVPSNPSTPSAVDTSKLHAIAQVRPVGDLDVRARAFLVEKFGWPTNVTIDIVKDYITAGTEVGIDWLVAFAQAIKETGGFKFGGDVKPEQHNYCGLGATGGGVPGASFDTQANGVLAHVEHLFAVSSDKPLPNGIVKDDPRFDLVKRNYAPYVEWLGKADNPNGIGWAVPGNGYGASVLSLVSQIEATPAVEPVQPKPVVVPTPVSKPVVEPTPAPVVKKPAPTQNQTQEVTPVAGTNSSKTTVFMDGKTYEVQVVDGKPYVDLAAMADKFGYRHLEDPANGEFVAVKNDFFNTDPQA